MLRFVEELALLLLDKESGVLVPVSDRAMRCAFAAAVLMDLALENRIDTDPERIILIDPTPTGDNLLDPYLKLIVEHDESRDTVSWIDRLAEPGYANSMRRVTLARLVKRGILKREIGGFFSLSSEVGWTRRYPMVDGEAGREVELRIMSALFTDEIASPRDIMLIALVDACRMFDYLLPPSEQAEVRDRIDLLCKMELIGRSISDAVRKSGIPHPSFEFTGLGVPSSAGTLPPPPSLTEVCRSQAMPLV